MLGTHAENASQCCSPCSCSYVQGRLIVDCLRRNLVDIPEDIPTNAAELNLAGNRLSRIPPGAFISLKNLTKLVLSFNAITRLETDSFIGLEDSLEYLDINLNKIPYNNSGYAQGAISRLQRLARLFMVTDPCPEEFPDPILSSLSNLKELAVAIPSVGSFHNSSASLSALDTLHISSNCTQSRAISPSDLAALHQLPLRRLSFRKANLGSIDPNALLPFNATLRKLDISCNALQNITELLTGLSGLPLDTLLMDRAVARFQSLGLDDRMLSALTSMNLSILTMSWNNFLEIDLRRGDASVNMPNLKYVRLGYNQISLKINSTDDLLLAVASLIMSVRVIDLDGLLRFYDSYVRVLNCNGEDLLFADKNLDWEYDKLRHKPPKQSVIEWLSKARLAFQNGTLTMPPQMTRLYVRDIGQLFSDLNCQEFPWQLNEGNNLQHIDVSYSTVPHVDCIVKGLGELYWLDAKEIGLISWSPMFFSNLSAPLLRHVNLHGNRLGTFLSKTQDWAPLNGTFNVTHLDLSSNGVIHLPVDVFKYSRNLVQLNLSWNKLYIWDISIRSSRNLETLDLSYNDITAVAPASLSEFIEMRQHSSRFQIDMTYTDLACYSCINEDFFAWYLKDPLAVVNLTCLDGKDRLSVTSHTLLVMKWQCLYLKIFLAGISSVTFVSLLAIVCQSYKWSIRYLYYKVRRYVLGFEGHPTPAPIEVYLSYAEGDSAKAAKTKMLLTKMGVQNVVTRDLFLPGRSQYEQIALHVDSCIAVVLLVSPTGMADPLTDFEFHMALEKGVSQIMLILTTEDLTIAKIPTALRKLLNKNNYLTWPAPEEVTSSDTETILSRRFNRFYIILEAGINNIINRTLASRRSPLITTEPDAEGRENGQCNEENLLASLPFLLGP